MSHFTFLLFAVRVNRASAGSSRLPREGGDAQGVAWIAGGASRPATGGGRDATPSTSRRSRRGAEHDHDREDGASPIPGGVSPRVLPPMTLFDRDDDSSEALDIVR